VVFPTIILKVGKIIEIKILGGNKTIVDPTSKGLSNSSNNLIILPYVRMSKVEDALSKIVSSQENNIATIRSMEIYMRQMVKQIAQIAEGQIDQFSANTTTNPKEHCNKITTK